MTELEMKLKELNKRVESVALTSNPPQFRTSMRTEDFDNLINQVREMQRCLDEKDVALTEIKFLAATGHSRKVYPEAERALAVKPEVRL